ncbi:MAG: hypothetical protein HYV28_09180 [Ignavibacteriales bacterium]|nr:hypothetical protein [Ignavibacteriales bacterium]
MRIGFFFLIIVLFNCNSIPQKMEHTQRDKMLPVGVFSAQVGDRVQNVQTFYQGDISDPNHVGTNFFLLYGDRTDRTAAYWTSRINEIIAGQPEAKIVIGSLYDIFADSINHNGNVRRYRDDEIDTAPGSPLDLLITAINRIPNCEDHIEGWYLGDEVWSCVSRGPDPDNQEQKHVQE